MLGLQSVERVGEWREVWTALEAAPHAEDGWPIALARLANLARAAGARVDAVHAGERRTIARAEGPSPAPGASDLVLGVWCANADEFRIVLETAATPGWLPASPESLGAAFAQAVRTQLSIEAAALRMTTSMLRRAGHEPIVCAPDGAVLQAPEALARTPLQIFGGRVSAACRQEDARLRAAVRAAAEDGADQVVVLGRETEAPLVADVLPPPGRAGACFRPYAVILLRGRGAEAKGRAPILQELYGLTSAEAIVALAVTQGRPLTDIAAHRGVAPSTVRTQVKAVLAKVGVGRQVELMHRLAAVC